MEIGMRKILGASLHQLVMLISQDFIKLIFIAIVTAVPISWWFMNRWLDNYALRVDISIWVYGGVGLGVLLLALLVIWLNTLKTAMGNPIKNLKSEI